MSRAEPGRPQLHLHAWKGGVMAMEKGRCLEGPSVLVGPAFGHEKKGPTCARWVPPHRCGRGDFGGCCESPCCLGDVQ